MEDKKLVANVVIAFAGDLKEFEIRTMATKYSAHCQLYEIFKKEADRAKALSLEKELRQLILNKGRKA